MSIKLTELRNRLNNMRIKAESVHSGLNKEVEELETLKIKWTDIDIEARQILSKNNSIVRFNVSGKTFSTKVETLLSIKDTIFYKMIISNRFDISKIIYFDRPYKYFQILLDYIRKKKFQIKRYSEEEISAIKIEAKYFEINDILKIIDSNINVEIIKIQYSGIENIKPEDLRDRTLKTGISVKNSICFELNKEIDLNMIEIGGLIENKNRIMSIDIFAGEDNYNMKYVGNIPNIFNEEPIMVDLIKIRARFIELRSNEIFSISYINIIK